jgi:hypothetical protein
MGNVSIGQPTFAELNLPSGRSAGINPMADRSANLGRPCFGVGAGRKRAGASANGWTGMAYGYRQVGMTDTASSTPIARLRMRQ